MTLSINFLLLLLALFTAGESKCPESDQIHCKDNDRCTRIRYICDGDNDCGDNSDEDSALCENWINRDCSRNEAMCYRFGSTNCMAITQYCQLSDPPCQGDVDPRICQMLRDELLQDINSVVVVQNVTATGDEGLSELMMTEVLGNEFTVQVSHTMKHANCPQFFTQVGDACVSVFYPGNVTWGEAREFCHTIGGEMLVLNRDYSFYATLVQHLKEHQMTADFWLGGTRLNDTVSWTWLDGSSIDVSLPYWAVRYNDGCNPRLVESVLTNATRLANQGQCYHFSRAPVEPMEGQCLALTYDSYFQMSDVTCLTYKSPLCIVEKQKD